MEKTIRIFIWGFFLLFSCKKDIDKSPTKIGVIPFNETATSAVANVLINSDGSVLVHTIDNAANPANFESLNINRFHLFDPSYQLIKTVEFKNVLLHQVRRDGNSFVFPGYLFKSFEKAELGVLVINDHLTENPTFVNYHTNFLDTTKYDYSNYYNPVVLERFKNNDWCLATTVYETSDTVFRIPHSSYLNISDNINEGSVKWRKLGNVNTVICGGINVGDNLLFTEVYENPSERFYAVVMDADGVVKASELVVSKADISWSFVSLLAITFSDPSGKVRFCPGPKSLFEFNENGKFIREVKFGSPYDRRYYMDNFLAINEASFVALSDSTNPSGNFTELVVFDMNLNVLDKKLFSSREKKLFGLNFERKLLKHPEGGYLLFLMKGSQLNNRYDWVFIRLDEDFNQPS